MTRSVIRLLALLGIVLLPVPAVRSGEPIPVVPPPVPRIAGPAMPPEPSWPGNPMYYRTSAYTFWNYYGVDHRGRWLPIVVYSPYGPYYLYNGQPYPWATVHPREFAPNIVGAPYISAPK